MIERDRAASGLIEHMKILGLELVTVRWMPDAEEGYLRAERGPGNSDWKRRVRAAEGEPNTGAGASAQYLTRGGDDAAAR